MYNLKVFSIILLLCLLGCELAGQYLGSPTYPNLTTGGGSNGVGAGTEMRCNITGSTGAFFIEDSYFLSFAPGTITLRENSSTGNIVATYTINSPQGGVTINHNFTFTSGSRNYYARYETSSGNYASWTGALQVTYNGTPSTPSIPTNFNTSYFAASSQVRLTWNDVSNETRYEIYRRIVYKC